jgi:hypothetical protein
MRFSMASRRATVSSSVYWSDSGAAASKRGAVSSVQSMGIDFRGIRRRIRWRLDRLYWKTADAQLKLVKRAIGRLGEQDKAGAAELEARVQEVAQRSKKNEEWALYTSIGQALSQWAGMEDSLIGISCLLLRTHEATKVGIILYSIANHPTWLNIIGELFLQEPRYITLRPRWNKISERLIKLNDTRVRLAHHTALAGGTSLRPGKFDVRPKSQKHRFEPLDYDQISQFIYSVDAVMSDLTELLNSMTYLLQRETSQ